LDWIGLDWIGLDWIGLDLIGIIIKVLLYVSMRTEEEEEEATNA